MYIRNVSINTQKEVERVAWIKNTQEEFEKTRFTISVKSGVSKHLKLNT